MPSKITSPLVALCRRRMVRPVVVLPQPLSPTRPKVSPLLIVEADAVDRLDVADLAAEDAAQDREVGLQVLHLEQHLVLPP